jgi:hypothetical protein
MEQVQINFLTPPKRPWRNPILPLQLCACGCGRTTNRVYGRPKEFIVGHALKGSRNNHWNGGKSYRKGGKKNASVYGLTRSPQHPRATNRGYVPDHVLAAEKILSTILPISAVVHHKDGDSLNNAPSNFVICQDTQYHSLLHARQRALRECGHASWRKCQFCHQYDSPENLMVKWKDVRSSRHRDCYNHYQKEQRRRRELAQGIIRHKYEMRAS